MPSQFASVKSRSGRSVAEVKVQLYSQPSVGSLLRSTQPGAQTKLQVEFAQVAVLCGRVQAWLHPPQLFGSLVTLVSQPSGSMPLQLSKPVLHVSTRHTPTSQRGVA